MHTASTHTQDDITKQEEETGLRFAGFWQVGAEAKGKQVTTLIPVLMRPDTKRKDRVKKIKKLNRG